MSLIICAVYCLVVLVFASLAFVVFTRMWTSTNESNSWEEWGGKEAVFYRRSATIAGGVVGFCAVHLLIRDENMGVLAVFALCGVVFLCLVLACAVVTMLGILWFKWLHRWATRNAAQCPET